MGLTEIISFIQGNELKFETLLKEVLIFSHLVIPQIRLSLVKNTCEKKFKERDYAICSKIIYVCVWIGYITPCDKFLLIIKKNVEYLKSL